MEVIVMAGGLGTRLKQVVDDVPKPMAPIGDRPFLAYLLDYWISLGARHFILSVGHKYQVIQNYFGDFYGDVPISYAIEDRPLGTGGGLILATQKLSSPEDFFVLNGDTLVTVPIRAMLEFHRMKDSCLTLALREETHTARYGSVVTTSEGQVTTFKEKGGADVPGLINAGVYLFSREALKAVGYQTAGQSLSLEKDIFQGFLRDDLPVFGFKSNGLFLDIGIPEDYKRASDFMKVFKLETASALH